MVRRYQAARNFSAKEGLGERGSGHRQVPGSSGGRGTPIPGSSQAAGCAQTRRWRRRHSRSAPGPAPSSSRQQPPPPLPRPARPSFFSLPRRPPHYHRIKIKLGFFLSKDPLSVLLLLKLATTIEWSHAFALWYERAAKISINKLQCRRPSPPA